MYFDNRVIFHDGAFRNFRFGQSAHYFSSVIRLLSNHAHYPWVINGGGNSLVPLSVLFPPMTWIHQRHARHSKYRSTMLSSSLAPKSWLLPFLFSDGPRTVARQMPTSFFFWAICSTDVTIARSLLVDTHMGLILGCMGRRLDLDGWCRADWTQTI